MKAFRNPLENILAIRRMQQRQRETELHAALRQRDEEQTKLDGILARQQAAARLVPSAKDAVPGQTLLQREHFVEHQRRLAQVQTETVNQAEATVASRQGILVEARREVRTFEVHRAKLHERWQAAARQEEQLRTDDIVGARWARDMQDPADSAANHQPTSNRQVRA